MLLKICDPGRSLDEITSWTTVCIKYIFLISKQIFLHGRFSHDDWIGFVIIKCTFFAISDYRFNTVNFYY